MRYNSLRNLSQFMSTDPATWNIESKELEKSYPYGAPTHAPTVGWLIGRPSTYASIISTIQDRGYVTKKGNELIPTFTAFAVIQLLEQNFEDLVSLKRNTVFQGP